jgi:kynurenine formamidase
MRGGLKFADDRISTSLQGSSQYDALGHAWYEDQLYNGFPATTTVGGMQRCGVDRIATQGIVGRGVLIDIARYLGAGPLRGGQSFGLTDLLSAAETQGVEIRQHDNLLIRTGWLNVFYEEGPKVFFGEGPYLEPGLAFSPELVRWFHEMEIVSLSSDTIGNEATKDPSSGVALPLHAALMRNLGVLFSEIIWLEDLAADCEADGRWSFLYAAAPINVVEGTGAPVNPLVIK